MTTKVGFRINTASQTEQLLTELKIQTASLSIQGFDT